jgi:hypothetical protein
MSYRKSKNISYRKPNTRSRLRWDSLPAEIAIDILNHAWSQAAASAYLRTSSSRSPGLQALLTVSRQWAAVVRRHSLRRIKVKSISGLGRLIAHIQADNNGQLPFSFCDMVEEYVVKWPERNVKSRSRKVYVALVRELLSIAMFVK